MPKYSFKRIKVEQSRKNITYFPFLPLSPLIRSSAHLFCTWIARTQWNFDMKIPLHRVEFSHKMQKVISFCVPMGFGCRCYCCCHYYFQLFSTLRCVCALRGFTHPIPQSSGLCFYFKTFTLRYYSAYIFSTINGPTQMNWIDHVASWHHCKNTIHTLRPCIIRYMYTYKCTLHTVWNGHHKMDFDEDWKIKHENYYLIYVCVWW